PLASDGPEPVKGYRAVSVLAILSLILGLSSVMTIFSPLLGFVALAAIVVSCVALRQIAVNSDRMSGRSLAVMGVILPCLFLGWGLGCDVFRRERVIGYA